MLAQLERQYVQADLAQARELLVESQRQEDPIAEHQYKQRVTRLEQVATQLSQAMENDPAGVALFFGGQPVVGSHGIKASFGSQAVGQFQKLVSQRYAAVEFGPLSTRGRVPMSEDTQLLVTGVVRGSFGFVLQAPEPSSGDALLKQVVDEVADTLSRMASADDALFDEASASVDNRQLGALREFFKLLDDEGASMRVVEGDRDFELSRQAIQRARQRAEALTIAERVETLEGEIIGWTEYSSRFELRVCADRSVVMGHVARDVAENMPSGLSNPLHSYVRVHVKVREVRSRNRPSRMTYTLRSIEPLPMPPDWPVRGTQAPF